MNLTGMDLLLFINDADNPDEVKVVVDYHDRIEEATNASYDAETRTLTIYV